MLPKLEVSLKGSYCKSPGYIQSNVVAVLKSLSAFLALFSAIVEVRRQVCSR
jgi:hypothetical protein